MFDRIAPRYDLMNRLMTFGADRAWRRRTIEAARLYGSSTVVDLGCGTGDLAAAAAAGGAQVVGIDLAARMLARAAERLPHCAFVRADAAALPLPDACCEAVVSGFALRNFARVDAVLAECARILAPGGRLALLEIDLPRTWPLRFGFELYFRRLVPLLGRLLSHGAAYSYLASSTVYLPSDDGLARCLDGVGFEEVRKERLTGGLAQLVVACRSRRRG